MTKAEKILRFIEEFGPVSLAEIQAFIIRVNYGDERLEFRDKANGYFGFWRRNNDRGYYCTNLYGSMHRYYPGDTPGLLLKYCTKLPDDRWILTEEIRPPFYRMPKETRSYRANIARLKGEAQLRREARERKTMFE